MSRLNKYILEKGMPKGWDKSSISQIAKKIGKKPDEKGFFTACVARLGKHMDDKTAKGLCANMKDTALGTTHWRGKDKDK